MTCVMMRAPVPLTDTDINKSRHLITLLFRTHPGADLQARSYAGKSLLMACVDGGKPASADWLLARWEKGTGRPLEALLEGRSAVGYTPLWWVLGVSHR